MDQKRSNFAFIFTNNCNEIHVFVSSNNGYWMPIIFKLFLKFITPFYITKKNCTYIHRLIFIKISFLLKVYIFFIKTLQIVMLRLCKIVQENKNVWWKKDFLNGCTFIMLLKSLTINSIIIKKSLYFIISINFMTVIKIIFNVVNFFFKFMWINLFKRLSYTEINAQVWHESD